MRYAIILFLMSILDCSNVQVDTNKKHHTKDGFKNLSPNYVDKSFGDVIRWWWNRSFSDRPSRDPADYKIESTVSNGEHLKTSQYSVTWVGHATVLIQMNGINILTDPIWSERCSPVSFAGPKRYTAPGIKLDDLPTIHAVIISHNHYDHMDLPTLKILDKKFKPVIIAGLKNKKFLQSEGLTNVVELDWWDTYTLKDVEIVFTPTQHFTGRTLWDRYETLWGSYILKDKNKTFYFAGDTGYFSGFKEIGEKFPNIDLAILPIGAYLPRDFMSPVHVDPDDSYKAYLDLKAKFMLPMHYNTFALADEALDEPLKRIKNLFQTNQTEENLFSLKIGEHKILKE